MTVFEATLKASNLATASLFRAIQSPSVGQVVPVPIERAGVMRAQWL